MKLPRNLSGEQLIKALSHFGYRATRQTGSHVRLSIELPKEHHLTVPLHDPLRVGTLAAILARIFHEFTAPSLVFIFRMEILFRRAYESLRRSFTKLPYETKPCAIITAIHEISGLAGVAAHHGLTRDALVAKLFGKSQG